MSYKVINYFEDLQDFNHPYKVGDMFPRLGMKVSEARLKELSTSKNRQKKPLIEFVNDVADVQVEKKEKDFSKYMNPPTEEKTYTKTDINRLSTAELKALAKEQAIDGAEDMTGGDLKKVLIEKFGL